VLDPAGYFVSTPNLADAHWFWSSKEGVLDAVLEGRRAGPLYQSAISCHSPARPRCISWWRTGTSRTESEGWLPVHSGAGLRTSPVFACFIVRLPRRKVPVRARWWGVSLDVLLLILHAAAQEPNTAQFSRYDCGVPVAELSSGSQSNLLRRNHVLTIPTVLLLDTSGKHMFFACPEKRRSGTSR
jgi:hypothetical protein